MLIQERKNRQALIEALENDQKLTLVDNAVNQATIHYLQNCTSFEEFEMSLEDLDIMEDLSGTKYYDRVVEGAIDQIRSMSDEYNITVEDNSDKWDTAINVGTGLGLGLLGLFAGKKLLSVYKKSKILKQKDALLKGHNGVLNQMKEMDSLLNSLSAPKKYLVKTVLATTKEARKLTKARDELLKGKDFAKLTADELKKLQSIQADMIKFIKDFTSSSKLFNILK